MTTPATPSTLDRGASAPLWQQLARVLRREIESGLLRPDQALPSESELIDRYGVSRTVVREALAELVRAGLIYKVRARGSFVAPQTPGSQVHRFDGRIFRRPLQRRGAASRPTCSTSRWAQRMPVTPQRCASPRGLRWCDCVGCGTSTARRGCSSTPCCRTSVFRRSYVRTLRTGHCMSTCVATSEWSPTAPIVGSVR